MTILLLEDDAMLRRGLMDLFTREGYQVRAAASIGEASRVAREGSPVDLAVLDVLLPDGNGVDFCRTLRREGLRFPVLFLSCCDEETDIVRGLDSGGDDYMTKPFGMRELLSRVRALLRRQAPVRFEAEGFAADLERMTVHVDGDQVYLTQTEFRLLSLLLQNAGRVVTRAQLLGYLWDDSGQFVDDNTLSVHMSRLREKIGARYIRTMRGVGYQWIS